MIVEQDIVLYPMRTALIALPIMYITRFPAITYFIYTIVQLPVKYTILLDSYIYNILNFIGNIPC